LFRKNNAKVLPFQVDTDQSFQLRHHHHHPNLSPPPHLTSDKVDPSTSIVYDASMGDEPPLGLAGEFQAALGFPTLSLVQMSPLSNSLDNDMPMPHQHNMLHQLPPMQPILDPTPPTSTVTLTTGNTTVNEGGGGEQEAGSLSPEGDEKRKWMTKEQAEACQKAFEEWNGSIKGKGAEVVALAESIGLTVSGSVFFSLRGGRG